MAWAREHGLVVEARWGLPEVHVEKSAPTGTSSVFSAHTVVGRDLRSHYHLPLLLPIKLVVAQVEILPQPPIKEVGVVALAVCLVELDFLLLHKPILLLLVQVALAGRIATRRMALIQYSPV